MRTVSVVSGIVLITSCAAVHHPPPMPEPERSQALRQELPRWVVGVREPVVRYSDPDGAGPDVMDELRDSVYLIQRLRRTGLFEAVDFSKQLPCQPDIELVARPREEDPLGPAPLWLWPITLSLVILKDEEGVSFSPASDPSVVFDFPYPTTLDVGILALVASPLLLTGAVPTWSVPVTASDPRDEALKVFILSNADRLQEVARGRAPRQ
jgi:hypothetical protein